MSYSSSSSSAAAGTMTSRSVHLKCLIVPFLHLLLLHLLYTIPSSNGSRAHELIREDLLKDYSHKVAPKGGVDGKGALKVFFDLTLNYFNIHEGDQNFIAHVWLRLTWNDSRLVWNVTDYPGQMHFGHDEIWHPDISIYNSPNPTEIINYFGDTHLLANYTGEVTWIPPARITSICALNLIKWPYDTQTCSLKFGSWTYSGNELDLQLSPAALAHEGDPDHHEHEVDEVELDLTVDFTDIYSQIPYRNMEWDLMKMSAHKTVNYYAGYAAPFVDLEYEFELVRRSPSYTICIILPIIVISFVNIMVFLLPPTSGEKITLGGINTLIVCIYLIYLETRLPNLGDHVPLIVLFYACNLVLMGLSLIISILVINLARTSRVSTPPHCLRLFCNVNFASVLGLGHLVPFVSKTHSRLEEETGVEMQSPQENSHHLRHNNSNSNHHTLLQSSGHGSDKDDLLIGLVQPNYSNYGPNSEWILLASMIDRIALLVYAVIWGIVMALCI